MACRWNRWNAEGLPRLEEHSPVLSRPIAEVQRGQSCVTELRVKGRLG
jgi:hypothetical protein